MNDFKPKEGRNETERKKEWMNKWMKERMILNRKNKWSLKKKEVSQWRSRKKESKKERKKERKKEQWTWQKPNLKNKKKKRKKKEYW